MWQFHCLIYFKDEVTLQTQLVSQSFYLMIIILVDRLQCWFVSICHNHPARYQLLKTSQYFLFENYCRREFAENLLGDFQVRSETEKLPSTLSLMKSNRLN